MFNNKYSKLLTIILVVVIVIIVGLLGYFAYDVYKKNEYDSDSKEAASRFEEELNRIVNTITGPVIDNTIPSENIQANTIINPGGIDVNAILDNNTVDNNTTNGGNSSNGSSSNSGTITKTKEGYDVIGLIEIPKTNIKYPIIKQEDVSINSLNVAICNLYGELNKIGGNAVLVGHNFRNGTFFSNNSKLTKGDKIYITDSTGKKVTYRVTKKYETSSGDFDYATRQVAEGKREISLSTCTNDSKKRLIIWAEDE